MGNTREQWLKRLDEAGVPCGPINTVDEAFRDPQIRHRGMEIHMQDSVGQNVPLVGCPIKLSGTPVEYNQAPPKLGEHTDDVLRALGYDAARIATLREQGTV
jgi:crotonobetainyl-CoA:carnitine CoA-transferase CaiB-like acyl-CoA transferase